jgi:hypothetical protein
MSPFHLYNPSYPNTLPRSLRSSLPNRPSQKHLGSRAYPKASFQASHRLLTRSAGSKSPNERGWRRVARRRNPEVRHKALLYLIRNLQEVVEGGRTRRENRYSRVVWIYMCSIEYTEAGVHTLSPRIDFVVGTYKYSQYMYGLEKEHSPELERECARWRGEKEKNENQQPYLQPLTNKQPHVHHRRSYPRPPSALPSPQAPQACSPPSVPSPSQ